LAKRITYPHSFIADKCREKYGLDPWALQECIVNSLMLYYGKISKAKLDQTGQKYVTVAKLVDISKLIEKKM